MEHLLPPGDYQHKVFCLCCEEPFNLENRRPWRKLNSCGHTVCDGCRLFAKIYKGKYACPECKKWPNPMDNDADKFIEDDALILDLRILKNLTDDFARCYEELQQRQEEYKIITMKFALFGGSRFMKRPFMYDKEWSRPEHTEKELEEQPRLEVFNMIQAIKQLKFDIELAVDLSDHYKAEARVIFNTYLEVVYEKTCNVPFDPSHSVTIAGIHQNFALFDWLRTALQQMEIDEETVCRRKVEFPYPRQVLRVQFSTEQVRNQFVEHFNGVMRLINNTTGNLPYLTYDR